VYDDKTGGEGKVREEEQRVLDREDVAFHLP
jgi:hypothetical protein